MKRLLLVLALGCCIRPLGAQTMPGENLRVTNETRIYQLDKNAVVNISSTRIINAQVGTGDELFDRFFQSPVIRRVPTQSLGSGFIINAAGYIVTNEHVIDRASEVSVTLVDGQKLPAQVLATDNDHDLAILKVTPDKGHPLTAIALGSSDDLMIGEPVYAIGDPFGYANTMTRGIVSATQRDLDVGDTRIYKGLIQTDASINPGNSGGPLINAYGQVIGINTAIRAEAHGIGFAIGVSKLRDLLPSLMNTEALNRTQLGFTLAEQRTLTPPATVTSKIIIQTVTKDSAADKAGVVAGDQLVAIGGQPATFITDSLVQLLSVKPNDLLSLALLREGKSFSVAVKVTVAPPPESETIISDRLGMSATTITPALAESAKLSVDTGILITVVTPGGPADKAGLQANDILFQLGPYYVSTVEDVARLVKPAEANLRVRAGVIRGDARGHTVITLK